MVNCFGDDCGSSADNGVGSDGGVRDAGVGDDDGLLLSVLLLLL